MGQHLVVGPQGRLEEALFLLAVNPAESERFVPEVRNSTCWNSGWVVSATAPLLCPSSGPLGISPPVTLHLFLPVPVDSVVPDRSVIRGLSVNDG